MKWFKDNQIKANGDKCHLLASFKAELSTCIDKNIFRNSKCEKPLSVRIDRKLNFNANISDICKKAE